MTEKEKEQFKEDINNLLENYIDLGAYHQQLYDNDLVCRIVQGLEKL